MSWISAWIRGLLIFLYFVVATVILPNSVLRLEFISRASSVLRDLAVLTTWGAGFVVGLYALRRLQRRGVI